MASTDPKLHALDAIATDADGDPYLHVLMLHEPLSGDVTCVECRARATYPHPRYGVGVELVQTCRGLVLCDSDGCRRAHLIRHLRAKQEAAEREDVARKGARAA